MTPMPRTYSVDAFPMSSRAERYSSIICFFWAPADVAPYSTNAMTMPSSDTRPKRQSKARTTAIMSSGATQADTMLARSWAMNPSRLSIWSSMTSRRRPVPVQKKNPRGSVAKCSRKLTLSWYNVPYAAMCDSATDTMYSTMFANTPASARAA